MATLCRALLLSSTHQTFPCFVRSPGYICLRGLCLSFRSAYARFCSRGASPSFQSKGWAVEEESRVDEEWYRAQAEDEEWFRREEAAFEIKLANEEASSRHKPRSDMIADYLGLPEASLFAQCRMDTFRASGPGGQHRNKTDSGVRLTHLPTGLVAQAVEDRSQHKNRATAMGRLRLLIATKVRRPVKLRGYIPSPELIRLLPPETVKKSNADKIRVNHPDYAMGIQALLDLLAATEGYVFYAAGLLKVNPSALSKVLTADKTVLQATNELLISKGQKPFK